MCILRIAETRYDWMGAFGNKNDAKAIAAGEGNRELQQKATNWQGQLSRAGSSNSKEFFSLFDSPTCHWRSFNCLRVLESSRVFPLPKALTQFRMNPPSHKPCLQEVTAKMKTGSAVRSTRTDMSSCRESWGNSPKQKLNICKIVSVQLLRQFGLALSIESSLVTASWVWNNMEEWEKIFHLLSTLCLLALQTASGVQWYFGFGIKKKAPCSVSTWQSKRWLAPKMIMFKLLSRTHLP